MRILIVDSLLADSIYSSDEDVDFPRQKSFAPFSLTEKEKMSNQSETHEK